MIQIKEKLGKRIAELRKISGLTQEQLAERSGLSVDFISRVERATAGISVESLHSIAKALQVEMKSLFEFQSHTTPQKLAGLFDVSCENEWDEQIQAIFLLIRHQDVKSLRKIYRVLKALLEE